MIKLKPICSIVQDRDNQLIRSTLTSRSLVAFVPCNWYSIDTKLKIYMFYLRTLSTTTLLVVIAYQQPTAIGTKLTQVMPLQALLTWSHLTSHNHGLSTESYTKTAIEPEELYSPIELISLWLYLPVCIGITPIMILCKARNWDVDLVNETRIIHPAIMNTVKTETKHPIEIWHLWKRPRNLWPPFYQSASLCSL